MKLGEERESVLRWKRVPQEASTAKPRMPASAGRRISDMKARKRKGIEMKMLALPVRVLPLGTYVVVEPIDTVEVEGVRQKITPAERGNRAKG